MRTGLLLLALACTPLPAGTAPASGGPKAGMVTVTDANFRAEVEQAKELVLVEFWANWCGPCKMLAPVLQDLSAEYAGRVKICLVEVSDEADNPQLARRFDPEPLPCLVLLRSGREVDRRIGAGGNVKAAAAILRRWLDRALGD